MRPKYRDMVSEEEIKERYEKIIKRFEEETKNDPDPAKIPNVECEWETEEEMEKWIEENNRKFEESLKNATIIACEDITRDEAEKWLENLKEKLS